MFRRERNTESRPPPLLKFYTEEFCPAWLCEANEARMIRGAAETKPARHSGWYVNGDLKSIKSLAWIESRLHGQLLNHLVECFLCGLAEHARFVD
jgi:hypothetical protein